MIILSGRSVLHQASDLGFNDTRGKANLGSGASTSQTPISPMLSTRQEGTDLSCRRFFLTTCTMKKKAQRPFFTTSSGYNRTKEIFALCFLTSSIFKKKKTKLF